MTNQQYVLAFDGQDDYVNLGKKSEFKVEKNITLEAWINVAAQKQWAGIICNIFDTGNTESGYGLLLDGSSGFYFGLKLSSLPINYPYSGANTINLSQWHHIAGTYDGQHMRFYIDGVEIFKNPIAGNKLEYNPENDLLIGMYKDDNESYAFRGKIAEVRLWNVVRSSDEIKANMKQRLKGNEAGLVGYWPLNESSGNTVTDKTGKGNNGTINGATWVQEELPIQPTPLNLVTNSKIKLKSWKGDYLHRPDTAQGVDTGGTGAVSEWIIESIGDNKIKLKSSKGDYLHRPDTVQGVTTWGTGIGNEWIVELIGDKKIKLKSWKGDYLHRPDTAQGVTTWGTGIGNEWMVEFISTEKPPTSQTLEDGLIAHYLFDSNAQDTSGHNLHGTVHGATLTTDRFGIPESAYQFDGVDDYIEVPHNDLLNLTDNLTISLWLKQEAGKAAGYRLVEKGSYGVNDGYNFDTYDGSTGRKLRLCGGVQNAQANTVYSLNEWHHVAVVFSKGVSTFYLDGKPDGSAPHGSPSIRTNSLSLLIGSARGSKAEFFKGALDDIRIYNRALSEQQIKAIHQLPSSKKIEQTLEDGLIAHYLFDSNAQDTSGHNLHGTVHGATLTTDRFGIPESAYQFDGVDDYIEVPHNDLLNLTDNLTISLWLKQEAGKAAGYRLVEKGSYGVNDGYNFDTYDGSTGRKLRLCGGVQNAQANTVYSLNEWHHVAVVFSKGVSTFYLDGKPDGSAPHGSPSIRTNSLSLLIGSARGSKAEFFKGALDDIRIYNRALSEQQIKAIHQLPSRKPQVKTGKIVVNGDEWTLSNDGIKVAPDGAVFATNIAKWFVGDRPGKFHAYSTNFGLTQSALAEAMKKVGHTWTTGTNIKFDLPTLLTYDGIFVGGDAADNQVLIEYVKAGGNVYIMAGTGWGGAQGEADHWNPFLNAFGFKLLGEYNDVRGNQPINYSHPILAGVKELYQQSTNPIVNLDGASGKNQLILTRSNGQGLIATFEGTSGTAVTLGGNTVDDKAYADTRSKFYLVDTNSPINGVGEVTGWEIWAENTLPVQLIIYRKAANSWSVVGQSEVKTPVVGFNDFSLSAPIKVEKGDFVGAYYPQQGSVSFSKPDNEAWDLGNLNGKVLFTGSGAASTAFSGSSNRIYSIRVKGNLA
jgi:hypothetical protein